MVPVDLPQSAAAAGLRYVNDAQPGIRRRRQGPHFIYTDATGKRVRDPIEVARIKALAIPPAYTDVWISPLANGYLQATGRDARGRKQYRYHRRWAQIRDETKFERMFAFAGALPRLRAKIAADLALRGLPRERILATVVQLLERTLIRVGNEEYARANASFGLTTLRDDHIEIHGSVLRFRFRGKSGKQHAIDLKDKRLAAIVQRSRDIPGQELFQYLDEDGNAVPIDSADVNDYIREATGAEFTAKDFRTWVGTVECGATLTALQAAASPAERKRNLKIALERVASQLGNTVAVCRKASVHPEIIDAYLDTGKLKLTKPKKPPADGGLLPEELAVLQFLDKRVRARGSVGTQELLRASVKRRRPASRSRRLVASN